MKEHRYSNLLRPFVFLGDLAVMNFIFFVLYWREHYVIATYKISWFNFLAIVNVSHVFDHYGQMAVYARLQSVVPPASRR